MPVTIEKVAINAVLAGCKPEYLPVVIAAVEAALLPPFCMHGLLATTYFSGPMVVVCGPLAKAVGMNSRGNALGQGNRANATIGRALQLVIRNVGGGRPQGVDRATLGNPGKYTFCFAEDGDPEWSNLNEDAGLPQNANSVTLFAADGVQGIVDQKARTPEPLCPLLCRGPEGGLPSEDGAGSGRIPCGVSGARPCFPRRGGGAKRWSRRPFGNT